MAARHYRWQECSMRHELIRDLADCTEFRQSLQARPPRLVHGTLFLLASRKRTN